MCAERCVFVAFRTDKATMNGENTECKVVHTVRCPTCIAFRSCPIRVYPLRHTIPAVIVSIAGNKARQDEKEIYGQITVVDGLVGAAVKISFQQMIAHNKQGGYSSQSVKNFVTGFGGKIYIILYL